MQQLPEGIDASVAVPGQGSAPPGRIDGGVPPERQLAPGSGKLGRITQHGKGLAEDITAWVELKMKLTQIELEERVEAKLNHLVAQAIVGVIAALAGLFALLALALGLGGLFDLFLSTQLAYFLGFFVVMLLLLTVAAVLRARQPALIHVGDKKARVDEEKLAPEGLPRDGAPHRNPRV